MINLTGKTAVVFGLANKRSIAWGIAQQLQRPAQLWPSAIRTSA